MRPVNTVDSAAPLQAASEPLSRFEGHCLARRTRECEELLQLAVLGVEQARQRHVPDQDLAEIAGHLSEAESGMSNSPASSRRAGALDGDEVVQAGDP
ncbi:hypothetical protein [Variovorax defluvii]